MKSSRILCVKHSYSTTNIKQLSRKQKGGRTKMSATLWKENLQRVACYIGQSKFVVICRTTIIKTVHVVVVVRHRRPRINKRVYLSGPTNRYYFFLFRSTIFFYITVLIACIKTTICVFRLADFRKSFIRFSLSHGRIYIRSNYVFFLRWSLAEIDQR